MKKIILLNLFASLFSFFSLAQPQLQSPPAGYPYAYFGFAGPTSGAGALGHAFMVFTAKPKVLLGGKAYQYNMKIPEDLFRLEANSNIELVKVATEKFSHLKLRMVLTKEDAYSFSQRYSNENRLVTLYRLKITEVESLKIQKILEADLARRNKTPIDDYSIPDKNCVTQMVDVVNQVVSEKFKVETNYNAGELTVQHYFNRNAWVSNIPVFVDFNFRNSPLVDNNDIYVIPSKRVNRIRLNMKLSTLLQDLGNRCQWSKEKELYIENLLFNETTRYRIALQKYIVNQITLCGPSAPADLKESFADLMLFDLSYYEELPTKKTAPIHTALETLYSDPLF